MYCQSCGTEIPDTFRYCSHCGAASGKLEFASGAGKTTRVLRRPRDDRKIAGVCSGLARYLGIDVTLVRILVVVFALWPPSVGLIFYIVCWIVMPQEPYLLAPPAQQPQAGTPVTT